MGLLPSMIRAVALACAVSRLGADVAPLTVVSGANGRDALKELAVLLEIKVRVPPPSPAARRRPPARARRTGRRARRSTCD